jgi:hypothetical protein
MAATDGERGFKAGEFEIQINLDFFQSDDAMPVIHDSSSMAILTAPRAAAETTPFSCFAQLISDEDPTLLTLHQPFVLRRKGKIVILGKNS